MSVSRLERIEELAEGGMETRRVGALKSVDKDPFVSAGCENAVGKRKAEIAMWSSEEGRPEKTEVQGFDMTAVEKRSRES